MTEPGRRVSDTGRIVYAWPPEGRFVELWGRFRACGFTDAETCELAALLGLWRREGSQLVAYEDPISGEWVDVDWSDVPGVEAA